MAKQGKETKESKLGLADDGTAPYAATTTLLLPDVGLFAC